MTVRLIPQVNYFSNAYKISTDIIS